MKARPLAIRVLKEVLEQGRSLSGALPVQLAKADEGERALTQELSYGVLRYYLQLDAVAAELLDKPLKAKDSDVQLLILMGLYQILYMRIPNHAAVSETVNVTKALKKPWARGLVNALLRRFLREREALMAGLEDDQEARYAHPPWFIEALKRAWPEQWQAVLDANNAYPPMTLRNNARQGSRDAYIRELQEAGLEATAVPCTDNGITLARAVGVERLPGFADGRVSVQDGAAQLAAELLGAKSGEHILDACAAPGGKLAHVLETAPETEVVAVDIDADRVARIEENLGRLRLEAQVLTADAANTAAWWDGRAFDRILLDAPCSATGVIRRHPDIKLLRRESDIDQLAELQARILDALWPTLRSGGRLLYVTCSVMALENHLQVRTFLDRHKDARHLPLEVPWGHACEVGRQILPGEDGMDGFYYALLEKD
jgi:16S rRNA (cytosine967-C5)-methyltransferase